MLKPLLRLAAAGARRWRGARPGDPAADDQQPLRAELFSADQMEQHGKALAGTGPFVFENYTRGQSVLFVKNPDYQWAPGYAAHQGPAWLDRVHVRFLPEYAVRAGALSSGQVDVIEGVQPTDIGLF